MSVCLKVYETMLQEQIDWQSHVAVAILEVMFRMALDEGQPRPVSESFIHSQLSKTLYPVDDVELALWTLNEAGIIDFCDEHCVILQDT